MEERTVELLKAIVGYLKEINLKMGKIESTLTDSRAYEKETNSYEPPKKQSQVTDRIIPEKIKDNMKYGWENQMFYEDVRKAYERNQHSEK